jgi:hypothetical protein
LWDPSGTRFLRTSPQTSGTPCGTLRGRLLGRLKSQKDLGKHGLGTPVRLNYTPMCAHTHSPILPFRFHAPKSKFKTRQHPLCHASARLVTLGVTLENAKNLGNHDVVTLVTAGLPPMCARTLWHFAPLTLYTLPAMRVALPPNQSEVSRTIPHHSAV